MPPQVMYQYIKFPSPYSCNYCFPYCTSPSGRERSTPALGAVRGLYKYIERFGHIHDAPYPAFAEHEVSHGWAESSQPHFVTSNPSHNDQDLDLRKDNRNVEHIRPGLFNIPHICASSIDIRIRIHVLICCRY